MEKPACRHARFVGAYASMHPWEDFAETFALYLDMADVLDTANHTDVLLSAAGPRAELRIAANELNRSMGLIDLVHEVLPQPAREKLAFVDSLVRGAVVVEEKPAGCAT